MKTNYIFKSSIVGYGLLSSCLFTQADFPTQKEIIDKMDSNAEVIHDPNDSWDGAIKSIVYRKHDAYTLLLNEYVNLMWDDFRNLYGQYNNGKPLVSIDYNPCHYFRELKPEEKEILHHYYKTHLSEKVRKNADKLMEEQSFRILDFDSILQALPQDIRDVIANWQNDSDLFEFAREEWLQEAIVLGLCSAKEYENLNIQKNILYLPSEKVSKNYKAMIGEMFEKVCKIPQGKQLTILLMALDMNARYYNMARDQQKHRLKWVIDSATRLGGAYSDRINNCICLHTNNYNDLYHEIGHHVRSLLGIRMSTQEDVNGFYENIFLRDLFGLNKNIIAQWKKISRIIPLKNSIRDERTNAIITTMKSQDYALQTWLFFQYEYIEELFNMQGVGTFKMENGKYAMVINLLADYILDEENYHSWSHYVRQSNKQMMEPVGYALMYQYIKNHPLVLDERNCDVVYKFFHPDMNNPRCKDFAKIDFRQKTKDFFAIPEGMKPDEFFTYQRLNVIYSRLTSIKCRARKAREKYSLALNSFVQYWHNDERSYVNQDFLHILDNLYELSLKCCHICRLCLDECRTSADYYTQCNSLMKYMNVIGGYLYDLSKLQDREECTDYVRKLLLLENITEEESRLALSFDEKHKDYYPELDENDKNFQLVGNHQGQANK